MAPDFLGAQFYLRGPWGKQKTGLQNQNEHPIEKQLETLPFVILYSLNSTPRLHFLMHVHRMFLLQYLK